MQQQQPAGTRAAAAQQRTSHAAINACLGQGPTSRAAAGLGRARGRAPAPHCLQPHQPRSCCSQLRWLMRHR